MDEPQRWTCECGYSVAVTEDEMASVVQVTMQPAHVSLWLRPDTASKGVQTDTAAPIHRSV